MTIANLQHLFGSHIGLFFLMMAASLSNGLKQLGVIHQSGTPMTFGKYLSYLPETFTMIVANVIAYVVLVLTDQLNFASALGIGYGTNSLVDLLPGKRSMDLKSTPDDPAKVAPPPPQKGSP